MKTRYVDYLIINELEAGRATGIDVTDENGNPVEEKVKLALQKLKELGVSRFGMGKRRLCHDSEPKGRHLSDQR